MGGTASLANALQANGAEGPCQSGCNGHSHYDTDHHRSRITAAGQTFAAMPGINQKAEYTSQAKKEATGTVQHHAPPQ